MHKPVIIVLEGPDFAGKSTLANELVKLYGGPATVVPNGPPPRGGNLRDIYEAQIAGAAARRGLTVFDRLHVGELLYGPIYRGEARITNADRIEIDQQLDGLGALKVHVDASDAVLSERFRGTRGDDLVLELDTLLDIARGYRLLLKDAAAAKGWTTYSGESGSAPFDLLR